MKKSLSTSRILGVFLLSIAYLSPLQSAQADCTQFPESTTDVCIQENLVREQARAAAYEAARIAEQQAAAQRAADAMARQTAEETARRQAWGVYDPALGDCATFPNSTTPGCVAQNLEAERHRQADAAASHAEANAAGAASAEAQRQLQISTETELRKKWGIYDPALGDCSSFPASESPACIAQNLVAEQHRQADAEEAKAVANAAVIAAAEAQRQQQIQDEIDLRKKWGIYDPAIGNCSESPLSMTPECVRQNLLAEDFRQQDSKVPATLQTRLENNIQLQINSVIPATVSSNMYIKIEVKSEEIKSDSPTSQFSITSNVVDPVTESTVLKIESNLPSQVASVTTDEVKPIPLAIIHDLIPPAAAAQVVKDFTLTANLASAVTDFANVAQNNKPPASTSVTISVPAADLSFTVPTTPAPKVTGDYFKDTAASINSTFGSIADRLITDYYAPCPYVVCMKDPDTLVFGLQMKATSSLVFAPSGQPTPESLAESQRLIDAAFAITSARVAKNNYAAFFTPQPSSFAQQIKSGLPNFFK